MTAFTDLNDFVNKLFFDGTHQSVPVYLDLEDRETEKLSEFLRVKPSELDEWIGGVVLETLDFSKGNIYSKHSQALQTWQNKNFDTPPPFTALLLSLSVAAERMRKGEHYSANNYYQRLAEVLGVDEPSKEAKIRSSGKYTEQFWRALNRWLTEYDYAYGRPTAKQVNNWTYVSYALSQSLVRDGDRKRFHSMFADFGLSPGEKLNESAMALYLHEWMGRSGPSAWLKKLWASADLRQRVASAAAQELEGWDGKSSNPGESAHAYKKLGWVAVIRRFPRKQVNLSLATSADATDSGQLRLSRRSSEVVSRSLADVESLWFTDMPGTNLMVLAPTDKLRIGALFLGSMELEDTSRGMVYRHDSMPITPFIKDDSGPFYREVSRVSLHSKHLILCHANWLSEVQPHLERYARPGFECMTGNISNGLPSDWCLFQGVEFVMVPSGDVNEKVQCLAPLSLGATIQLSGGLKLAHNIWHASAPPDVLATNDNRLLEAQLRTDDLNAADRIIGRTSPELFDPAFINEYRSQLNSKNLKIVGLDGKRVVVEREICFRTAQTPRRAPSTEEASYVYPLAEANVGMWGLSAIPSSKVQGDACVLKGMVLAGRVPGLLDFPTEVGDLSIKISHDSDEENRQYNMESVSGGPETCALRGYHVFKFDAYLGGDPKSVSRIGECKDCSALKIAQKAVPRVSQEKPSNTLVFRETRVKDAGLSVLSVSPDSAFDAVCYLGSGTWNSLESVLSTIVSVPWEVSVAANDLVDLGLIDVALDGSFRMAGHWSCPPPAMVVTENGRAFLSGFRESSIVRDVIHRMKDVSEKYALRKHEYAPIGHTWDIGAKSIWDVHEKLAGVVGPLGRQLIVVNAPGATIIQQMPSMNEIRNGLRPIHIEDNGDIEKFDPYTGRWRSSSLGQPGSYRTTFCGRRYFHLDAKGQMVETGPELGKVLAARDENLRLHGYDESKQAFECVIGCQPPGILRRALVSYSGVLPELVDGRHVYRHVPKKIAGLLISKLYQ